jgi:hypothetical protein
MGSRSPWRHFLSLPPEVRHGPAACLGDAMARREVIWLRCDACRHTAVILPQILAQLAGYDCTFPALRRRLKCRQCGNKRVQVEAHVPGER